MTRKMSGRSLGIFISVVLAACSSHGKVSQNDREPNALTDIRGLRVDSAVSEILDSQHTQNETEALVSSITKIYFHAQVFLDEFDRQLDDPNGPGLANSFPYAQLLSARLLRETATQRVVDQYQDLLSRYWESLDKKTDLNEVRAELTLFRNTITQPVFLAGANRLALQDLAAELSEVPVQTYIAHYGTAKTRPKEVAAMQDFRSFLFKNTRELTAFIEDKANKADMNNKIAEATNERLISRNVNLIAPFLQLELQAQLGTRAPQSIGPGTGANGNLTGNNFPSNTWALTFDDGPSKYTLPILTNLGNHNIKASFFWLAENVSAAGASKYIQAAKAAGMDLNNHSYSHANLVNLNAKGLTREIVTSTDIETKAYGFSPKFFRCPYGSGLNTARVRQLIAREGMIHVFWNVDSLDWQDHNPKSIVTRVRKQMAREGRGIILFHDIHPQSVTASAVIMGDLTKLRAVTTSQITKELNGEK
jgi:peptidoglycan/xylan/chitin deacetylase (PgdA/CDA1 family)